MKKKVLGDNAYFTVEWSELIKYDKHHASRVLPELAGVLYFYDVKGNFKEDVLCFGCWREGLRMEMRNLFDSYFTKFPYLTDELRKKNLYYKFCVLDSSPADMKDVMYFLISTNKPILNNPAEFSDSKRYSEICVDEINPKTKKPV